MTLADSFPRVAEWRGRHVVICNWRDGRHPDAGGAELYCEEVARELREAGVAVTYLTARPRGTVRREQTGFGTVVRGGGRFTVYPFVLLWLLLHRGRVHGVIDSQNGIPFFAPLALRRRTPTVLLIHHVHQDQFAVWFPRPAAALGRWLENRGARLVYGRRAIAAVSPSSRAEIRARLSLRGPVHLAPCGQHLPAPGPTTPAAPTTPEAAAPEPGPRIVCVGRLVPQKRVDRLVRCVPPLRAEFPGLRLHIVGDGETRPELEKLAAELGITDAVVFHGRVTHEERDRLVASAAITATASMGEGWGLSVMEAAALGVPAVAYAVPGLRDTIRPGDTGWLAAPGEDLTDTLATALRAVNTPHRAEEWARRCRRWAARYGWDATAGHLLAPLTAERDRLLHLTAHHRSVTDASALVTLPAALLATADLSSLRATDLLDTSGPDAALLLVGADEHDAETVLARIGVPAGHLGTHAAVRDDATADLRVRDGVTADHGIRDDEIVDRGVSDGATADHGVRDDATADLGVRDGVTADHGIRDDASADVGIRDGATADVGVRDDATADVRESREAAFDAPDRAGRDGLVAIRLARHSDALGWRQHPPARSASPQDRTDGRPAAVQPASPPVPPPASHRAPTARSGPGAAIVRMRQPAALVGLFALALALRLCFVQRSYDLFIDEITYATVGRNLATGHGLTLYGHLFALHPPAFFALLAAVLRVTGQHGDILRLVMDLRPVDAVAGSLTVVAVTALLRRTVRTPIALVAGLLLACDPFLNRFDSRLMLEAPATAAASIGMLILARTPATARARVGTAVGAGLMFAVSITTKELYALVTFAPLALLAFAGRGPVRRMRLIAAATTVAGYAVYVAVTAACGEWSAWWTQKSAGVARAVGTRQITGFHQAGAAPAAGFSARLLADLGQFGVSYTVIVVGAAATVWLLVRRVRRPWVFADAPVRSVITAWAAGALAFLLYAGAFGTLEEQMFYPLVVTSLTALALAVDLVLPVGRADGGRVAAGRVHTGAVHTGHADPGRTGAGHGARSRRRAPRAVVAAVVVAALALAVDGGVWAVVHTRRDDTYRRTIAWTSTHIPEGSTVDVTEGSAQFLMHGVHLGTWGTVGALDRNHAEYLLMSTQLVDQGYSRIDPALLGQLKRRGRLLHAESGPTTGQLRVYDVRPIVAATSVHDAKGGTR
ncbi:glycosyltransferase [Streptantibioticus silvisoli]|uniref:Glycosyltransferase n=1 Tax=Streptantibioticus silvisoli TaxID=2705255 RepID=A0ABT6W824_9ACTN|nr:glycosyltransferase [Streptantibioticus silvisoli]MDI5966520.1 glycosyltransferase [Streptantibioticus silvisoli]